MGREVDFVNRWYCPLCNYTNEDKGSLGIAIMVEEHWQTDHIEFYQQFMEYHINNEAPDQMQIDSQDTQPDREGADYLSDLY